MDLKYLIIFVLTINLLIDQQTLLDQIVEKRKTSLGFHHGDGPEMQFKKS